MAKSFGRKLGWAALFILVANVADLCSTYLASPDLSAEWNMLQSKFNLGWAGLIIAKLIGGLLALAGYAYYLRHRDSCYPRGGLDRGNFCRHLSFGRPATWLQMQTGIPFGPHLGVNLGYFWTGMQLLIFWVALDNVLLHFGWYCSLRHISEMGYHMGQSLIVAVVVLARFYMGNYARYRSLGSTAITSGVPVGAVSVAR